MENSFIISIIVAMIVIVPGIFALITQIKKNKEQNDFVQRTMQRDMAVQYANLSQDINYTKHSINDRINTNIEYGDIVDKIWKKMYEKPVIVRCNHCKSPNVITSLNCTQCGAPIGEYKNA